MKHKHHIIPKHYDSPCPVANLTIELTIEEHADAHRILYEQNGKIQDKWAWKGLAGLIGKEELLLEIQRENVYHFFIKIPCPFCEKEISKHNLSRHIYSCTNGKLGTKANPTRKGIVLSKWSGTLKSITNGKTDRRIKHHEPIPSGWWEGSCRKGTKYNRKKMEPKKCITNGVETKRIPVSQVIPEGWSPGRHYKPNK